MRHIPHFSPFKKHKRANYTRHSTFFTFKETQTSELCETFLIFHPSRNTNERIMRDIPHFPPFKRHKRANCARHSSFSSLSRTDFGRTRPGEKKKTRFNREKKAALSRYPLTPGTLKNMHHSRTKPQFHIPKSQKHLFFHTHARGRYYGSILLKLP